MKFNIGWHVLYVKSYNEKKVHDTLEKNGLESFLPLMKTVRKWSDRKKIIYKSMFPSYVFVKLKSPREFHDVLDVNGVCAYIRFGKEYAKVSENEITKIKLLVGAEGITDIEVTHKLPKVGDIQKILYGPLTGLECEIIRVDNTKKIVVRIESLHQNITATIPPCLLSDSLVA
ncbi:Transcription antitermination protein RfaH [Kordia antarctica]|uniref:Transcription antitermination protein RfaH n=1 Tax=Kordia antarctica TaxID=1218801 RepID=A0A7L4ZJK3_9FLAO|nr:UpxY family transcription antiterminator [Kordia antarctica]QHI36908.1 Transcription antitermination protein RfaH [Kordia antarctica]